MCIGELYNYKGGLPVECETGRQVAVTDQCANYETYQDAYQKLRSFMYETDEHRLNHLDTERTKLVVLTGGMDVITPPRPVRKWLKNVLAPPEIFLWIIGTKGTGPPQVPPV